MNPNFKLLQTTRQNILNAISGLSIEELNIVPENFNNNILWNFGHIIVTQQLLCYHMAGLPLIIDADVTAKYRKGTKPEVFIDEEELQKLKSLAFPLLDKLEKDYENKKFLNYSPYETSYGAELKNIEEAIEFTTVHEALHYGYIMALKRAIK